MQAQRAGFALGPSPSPTLHLGSTEESDPPCGAAGRRCGVGPEPQAVFITNEHPAYPLLRRNSEWETGRKERPASRSQVGEDQQRSEDRKEMSHDVSRNEDTGQRQGWDRHVT